MKTIKRQTRAAYSCLFVSLSPVAAYPCSVRDTTARLQLQLLLVALYTPVNVVHIPFTFTYYWTLCDACVLRIQAIAMFNSTHIPFDDPHSVSNANVTITLLSSDTRPRIGQAYYDAVLPEESPVNTVVPRLSIVVTSTNLVCAGPVCLLGISFFIA